MPYLELKQDNEQTEVKTETVEVPNIKYKTLKEVEEIIKQSGLKIKYELEEGVNKEEKIVTSQIPSAGITVNKDSVIIIEYE